MSETRTLKDYTQHDSDCSRVYWPDKEPRFTCSCGLFALLAQPPAQGVWQPMETAPRDGTHILGCWTGVAGGKTEIDRTFFDAGEWCDPDGIDDCGYSEPQFWQPLPAPPRIAAVSSAHEETYIKETARQAALVLMQQGEDDPYVLADAVAVATLREMRNRITAQSYVAYSRPEGTIDQMLAEFTPAPVTAREGCAKHAQLDCGLCADAPVTPSPAVFGAYTAGLIPDPCRAPVTPEPTAIVSEDGILTPEPPLCACAGLGTDPGDVHQETCCTILLRGRVVQLYLCEARPTTEDK